MTRAILLLCCALPLTACGFSSANPGNPSGTPYAGEPGSVYDSTGPMRPIIAEPTYNVPATAPLAPQVSPGTLPPVSQVPGAPPRPQ